ncbi:MAG TPA: hypothetical protein VNE16_09105 [Vicinamibacterales bacterium]|nr:hypothetical protein [Vicinamibacterales bacterium]
MAGHPQLLWADWGGLDDARFERVTTLDTHRPFAVTAGDREEGVTPQGA